MVINDDFNSLITAFKGYRDLLTPIQQNLTDVVGAFDGLKDDLKKLDSIFDSGVKGKLNSIFDTLNTQAKQSADLSKQIDSFVKLSNKYAGDVGNLFSVFEKVEHRIKAVTELEKQAEAQITRLDSLIEEKKINYNIKDLSKSLDTYNTNVQKISDFINHDIAKVLQENSKKIANIRLENDRLISRLSDDNTTVDKLVTSYATTNDLLRRIVEKNEVNEEYIFDILDKWAASRKVKVKK